MGSEQHFRLLFERVPISYQSLDAQGRFLEVNQRWLDTLGYARSDVIGRSFEEEVMDRPFPLRPPQLQEESARLRERRYQGECTVRFETQRQHKDGRLIDVSMSTAPLYDSADNIIGDMGLMEDITERKRAERALRESEQRFRSLAEDISDWIWETDTRGLVHLLQPSCSRDHRIPAG